MKTKFSHSGRQMPDGGSFGHRHHTRKVVPAGGWCAWVVVAATFCGWVSTPPARADLSAPDNILYGYVVLGTNQVTANDTGFTVEARRANGLLVARYRMGDNLEAGDRYVLAIQVEEMEPRRGPTAVLLGEVLTITALSNSLDQAQQSFVVTERGQVTRLDFGTLPPNDLTGFEAWAQLSGIGAASQNEDTDQDGVSNLAEYLAGTNPTNATSRFLLRIAQTNKNTRVSFDAVRAQGPGYEDATRHYALERLMDLKSANWQAVPGCSDIIGSNQEVVYAALASGEPLFFRGKVWLQTAAENGFRLTTTHTAGSMEISFVTLGPDSQGRNRYYTLEHTVDPNGDSWTAVPGVSNVLGNLQTVTYPVAPTGVNAGFYRGRLELRSP